MLYFLLVILAIVAAIAVGIDLVVIKSGFLWIVWIVCFMVAEWLFIKYEKGDK